MRTGCRDSKFRTFLRVFSLCVMGIFAMQSACSIAAAEASTVTAVGNYRMGSYDTRGDAQRLAFLDAKWRLFDQIAASLGDDPIMKQRGFTREELRAYLPGILQIGERPLETRADGSVEVASVQATTTIDAAEVLHRLQYVLGSERAKVGLMQSRDKIDAYRKELDSYTQRLMTEDSSGVRRLLEYRRETFVLIESEEQVAKNWVELAHQPDAEPKGLPPSKGGRSRTDSVAPVIPHTPGNAEEHRKRGAALNDQGQYDEAMREFETALKLMPTLVRAHLGLGAAKQGKGDLNGAIAEYRTALRMQPDDSDAHNNLGTVLQQKGDMEGAIAEYRLALQEQPDDPLIHFNLGTALSVKGVEEQALTEYRTTVRLRPDFAPAYFYLGTILKQRRQMREAAEAFRNYLKLAQTTTDQQKWIEEAERFLLEKDERKPRPER